MVDKNFFSENDDIQFNLKQVIDPKTFFQWVLPREKEVMSASTGREYIASWMETLEALGQISGTLLVKNAKKIDKEGYKLEHGQFKISAALLENMSELKNFGIAAFGVDPKYGGMGAPLLMELVAIELINRACPSTMLNVGWYSSIAHIIDLFGTEQLRFEYIPKIATGESSGNMALTEPGAGSDLGAIRTYGQKQEDGSWKIFGTKLFISNGSADISLVLAKNEKGSQGLNALSLFLAPRKIADQDNIKITKLEDKIGLHGSATAQLEYDGSKAYLLGKEGEGFSYMLRLMNSARLGVAFQGIGLMEASLSLASHYAKQRTSWGKPIYQHELVRQMLLDMEVELKALRSLAYKAAYEASLIILGEKYLRETKIKEDERITIEKNIAHFGKRVRHWTPLLKYWVGESSYQHARSCMQILGGYGYTTEYDAEWLIRESLIYSLYEGTSQIQALMCIKDLLKDIVRHPAYFAQSAVSLKIKALSAQSPMQKKLFKIKQLSHQSLVTLLFKLFKTNASKKLSAMNHLDIRQIIKFLSSDLIKFENISHALLHAERICLIQAYEAAAESLVIDAEQDSSRMWLAQRFLQVALAKIQFLKTLIETDDETVLHYDNRYIRE